MQQPFSGLKVIELASVLAGPSVGMFFAELGATVVKVENKKSGGDVTRNWKLTSESKDSSISAYFCSVNWGKEYIFLDLSLEEDRKKVYELAKDADVIIANFKPGAAEKLKVDYATFKAINPTIIYGHITGYGENDNRPAYDVVLQAEAGYMSMTGTKESGSLKVPLAIIDILAAHHAKEGVLTALWQREKTGEGALVEVSLYDAAVGSLANQATNWLMAKHIPQKMGSLHPNIAPYGEVMWTKDEKEMVLAVGSNQQFHELCNILRAPHLAEDEKYSTNQLRVQNRAEMAAQLQPFFKAFNREELIEVLTKAKVPVGAIKNIAEVLDDEHAQHLILEEEIDGQLTRRVRSVVFNIS
jgi:crotonobetainyl-CoA:carnitine CoA-transferase CaiB-like acyl-CoA transferase